MRTYGLVCMGSCALTAITGDPQFWYGGHTPNLINAIDPGRIIQGITTGVGFLGAGVIMRDGMNISGLTTAASIWTVASIGVLVGVGFYGAAGILALASMIFMMWGAKLENKLPSRHAVALTLHFHKNFELTEADMARLIHAQGYEIARGSFSINQRENEYEWRFVAVSRGRHKGSTLLKLGESLKKAPGVKDFFLSHARN
jgi:putative Mg2+ transporter-C (MgtC) family protein